MGGLVGCSHQSKNKQPNYAELMKPSTPFGVSANRDLYYQRKNEINPSLFGLKQVFYKTDGEFDLAKKPSDSPVINSMISRAYTLVGKPYHYGGESAVTGFDCSGFVGYLYDREAGVELPRSTRQMINIKAPKVSKNNLKAGDVLFFATGKRRQVSHAAIYIGNDYFVHAANKRKGIRIDSLNNRYWNANFIEAKRILN